MSGARRFLYENGLTLFFGVIFLVALILQSLAGHASFNEQQVEHDSPELSYLRYITSSAFGVAVMENWQSEYLQFTLFILLTIWLLQRGSPESKQLGEEGRGTDQEQKVKAHADERSPRWAKVGGLRTFIFSNSLLFVMLAIWIFSWAVQAVAGVTEYNDDRLDHQRAPIALVHYLGTANFWERTLQNWQSEFLAVGSMAILAIYLRQRGSPESKPVGAPHHETSTDV